MPPRPPHPLARSPPPALKPPLLEALRLWAQGARGVREGCGAAPRSSQQLPPSPRAPHSRPALLTAAAAFAPRIAPAQPQSREGHGCDFFDHSCPSRSAHLHFASLAAALSRRGSGLSRPGPRRSPTSIREPSRCRLQLWTGAGRSGCGSLRCCRRKCAKGERTAQGFSYSEPLPNGVGAEVKKPKAAGQQRTKAKLC